MIIQNNEDAIRLNCLDVTKDEVDSLIKTLENELNTSNLLGRPGIGLAAPQLGIAKKIAIVRIGNVKINLVNCNITKFYDPFMFRDEGCLSFPGRVEETKRYGEIVIENNLVYPHSFTATGLVSVCCNHEIDHYNNKLFFEHANKKIIKQQPNEKCFCNSGLKFKKCCGK